MRGLQIVLLFFIATTFLIAQPNFNANDTIPPYYKGFGFGVNMGAYHGWTDDELANIAIGNDEMGLKGVGINALRVSLPENFVEYWGYDIRTDIFRHYSELGAKENVVFVGFPSDLHRDFTEYCEGTPSEVFVNLFEPIWDDGENGTPVNDNNFFAIYLYQLVHEYKDYVRFWQIWNEPDFSFVYDAVRAPGDPEGSWWDDNPKPCDYALKAPVFHYIRMLRISYEVIKYIDPTAYVTVGGLGYPSFLDAILRNTDNPIDGSVTEEYPLKGGAYFDVLSYHSYPHIDGSLRYWDNDIEGFAYNRHSDEAIKGVLKRKYDLEDVLFNYGYDGSVYPEKFWIITEANIPRKAFELLFGSDEAQKNFTIKSVVACQKEDIKQIYFYQLGEIQDEKEATHEYDLMGLYKNLNHIEMHDQVVNEAGIGLKTTSDLLAGKDFDQQQTDLLHLPENVDGGAFRDSEGNYTYVLWAITHKDNTERARTVIQLPKELEIDYLESKTWDYSETGLASLVHPQHVELSGSPIFLTPTHKKPLADVISQAYFSPNPFIDYLNVDFYLETTSTVQMQLRDMNGRLVRTLIQNEIFPEGAHRLQLDDLEVSSGVYVLDMVLGERVSAGKVVKIE